MQSRCRFSTSNRLRRPLVSAINVTPFVDVMLVLLIVFMITSPMLVPGVMVDLPNTVSKPIADLDKPLVVTITKDQSVYVQDQQVAIADVVKTLNAMAKDNKDKRVFIRGDKSVTYGVIARVIADIRIAGFDKLAIISGCER